MTATAQHYVKLAESALQDFAKDPTDAGAAFEAAGAYAQMNAADLAFEWLNKAITAGFMQAQWTQMDHRLTSLHTDPRWPGVLERMQIGAQREARLYDSAVWKTPYADQLPEDERIAGLSHFWSEVKYNFVFTDKLMELEWDAVYVRYLPQVRAAENTLSYYWLLAEMCALLRDGHTGVIFPPRAFSDQGGSPPFDVRMIEGRVFINRVINPDLHQHGIAPGVEILRINDCAVTDVGSKTMPFICASTPQYLEVQCYSPWLFLSGPLADALRLELRDASGKTWHQTVQRISVQERFKSHLKQAAFEWKLLPGNIAYVVLNTFESHETADAYLRAFPDISQAQALIFDIRANGGGSSDVGLNILGTLTQQPFAVSHSQTRNYRPATRAWGLKMQPHHFSDEAWHPHPTYHFADKVVVLTSASTYSAAEDFAVAFDAMQRGRIIGEATGGSTGQPLCIRLPGGGQARICTKNDTYPDGKVFIGVGVQPDLLVRPTVADFRAGIDTVLEAALAELRL